MAKQVVDDTKFTGIRLPKNVKPVHYDLGLVPIFTNFTFTGKVAVDYVCQGDVDNQVVVNAVNLKITDGHVGQESEKNPLEVVTYSPASETATLQFKNGLAPTGTIHLEFVGELNDAMKGFYRTTFKIGDSEVVAATTQFEATDARRCLPCWDEPAHKATFSVTMTIEKFVTVNGQRYERLALSNMPEVSRSGSDDAVEVKFEKTPIMSTYLLAFIVGPFEMIEATDGSRPIRVYTTPGKKQLGQFALDVACKSLPFYEGYFGIKYPLPKMDLIAIPDFTFGAMENWGLVTYRETCILFDPAKTSTSRKQYIAIVVAHELAHQWFGNLVTMEWWTHLWLNEGFASFMEFLCVDNIYPEYDIWSQFVADTYGSALRLDALHNSHPIEVPVNRPDEVNEIFDLISYKKGASVIRMLYNYIGDDSFRRGMKDYLSKFAYKNAQTEDLWDCLETASNKPVRKLMSCWTAQKGYPWLSVSYSNEGAKATLTLTQNKFTADGTMQDGDSESQWVIPIKAVTGNEPTGQQEICLLDSKTKEVRVDGVGDSWVKLNPGTIGLYRTAYPAELSSKLFAAIAEKGLPPMDRLGLQDDLYALCLAGKANSSDLLKLLSAFKDETDYTIWSSISSCMDKLLLIASNSDFEEQMQAFGRDLYGSIYAKIGWTPKPDEPHTAAMLRELVVNRVISLKHEGAVQEALGMYKQQLVGGATSSADVRGAVYRAASQFGDEATFESLFDIYREAQLSEEKCRALRALGYAGTEERLQRALAYSMTDEVRKQDKIFVIATAGINNPQAAWKFFKENGNTLKAQFGVSHLMSGIVQTTSSHFASSAMADEVAKFFETNVFPGCERTVRQSVENIRLNSGWLARDGAAIKEFLASC